MSLALQSHHLLDPLLVGVDLRLQEWAPWARPAWPGRLPHQSAFMHAGEGGRSSASAEWPCAVVEVDGEVARLPIRQGAAIMVHYFNLAPLLEERAHLYVRLVRHLGRTRADKLTVILWRRRARLDPDECGPAYGIDAFRRDLDRGRWMLKQGLRV